MKTEEDQEAARLIGKRIRAVRALEGLSQTALGKRVGLSQDAISGRENGEPPVSAHELARIAEATHKPVEWFLEDLDSRARGLYRDSLQLTHVEGPTRLPFRPASKTA